MPPGIVVALINVVRTGTYVEQATTDLAGILPDIGFRPGVYKLVFQFRVLGLILTNPLYHCDESGPTAVQPGYNHMDWTVGTNKAERMK